MAKDHIQVGDLRWLLQFVRRSDMPDPSTGVIENYSNLFLTWGDIRPIGTAEFIQGFELGIAVTHQIIIRWYDRLDEFTYVLRTTFRTDGSTKNERFRINRVADVDGRQKYSLLECQLESISQ
jgi:head-tail adaptor